MLALRHPQFRRLFAAQIASLLGIGVMTVALALSAYRIGGAAAAAQILGALFALKMIVYVFLAPPAEALLSGVRPKRVLIALDLLRLAVLLPLGFAAELWQVALLMLIFYAASAAFTPLFQALIPTLLDDDAAYAEALALSRLAYTFETVLSPLLAAAALLLLSAETLFALAAAGFAASALLLAAARLPDAETRGAKKRFAERLGQGLNIYRRTPRLRGLFLLNLALSFGLGWVLVNSVVFAALRLGDAERYYAPLMMGYGAGAAAAALAVPTLLRRFSERRLMIGGGLLFGLLCGAIYTPLSFAGLLLLWSGFGAASSLVLTPGGLVLTRSAAKPDRPALFAAQFSASHAGWLLAYPSAAWLGGALGLEHALALLGAVCALLTLLAARVWRADDPLERPHSHPDLPPDHPHLRSVAARGADNRHTHPFYVDDLHSPGR